MNTSRESSRQESGPRKGPFEDMNREELINKCKGLLTIAQRAKIAKSELQNEVENYKLQLEKTETEKNNNMETIKTLQELVDSLTEQKLNFITEVDSAQSKVKALNNKCVNYEEEIKHTKAELIVKDKNISALNQKISDFDIEITSLKRQNNRLVEENEQLISQLAEFEASAAEFNNIGLQQREQLKILEENTQSGQTYEKEIEELKNINRELEGKIKSNINLEEKINELTVLYETEKAKKDKAYIKLRSYKDKILKCAACITQLKNSRFILAKTVKEYSENIPKWQDDIIKASKALDVQMNDLNKENISLKEQVSKLEKALENSKHFEDNNMEVSTLNKDNIALKSQLKDLEQLLNNRNIDCNRLTTELQELKMNYEDISKSQLPSQLEDNTLLKEQLNDYTQKCDYLTNKNDELHQALDKVIKENKNLLTKLQNTDSNNERLDKLTFQIKALESEKATLLKEKLSAKDNVIELENQNKIISEQLTQTKSDLKTLQTQIESLLRDKSKLAMDLKEEKETEIIGLQCDLRSIQEKYNLLKKEHDDLQDLNGLLKEEVDTLKLSLEQPKDDAENLSELNESLQTDIVKLETKLGAYKQENASLLAEIKDSRNKSKEYDTLLTEYEEAKSKLSSYKSENTELLHEMKEINQALKERGEAISKLQKAITEMERLVETLEKDRDNMCQEKADHMKTIQILESDLKNADQTIKEKNTRAENAITEMDTLKKHISIKDATIASLKEEIEKLKQHQLSAAELPNEDMSTSTISKAEEHARMKDLDETFEEKYTKLRIFALKLKKKLNETISQLQQTELDKARLEKMFNESKSTLASKDELDNGQTPSQEVSNSVSELQDKIESLTADLESTKNSGTEIQKLKEELAVKCRELAAEIEAHKVTKDNLEKARRDVKKKNVLSLEMEDYERSMKDLSTKMEESKKKMVQMESTIDTQEGTITAMKTQIKLLEEQIKSEEKQNRLTKEELQHSIEDAKEKDNVIQAKIGIINKLEHDLEDEKRKNEEADLEMTAVLSEKEKIIMCLGEDKAELNNKVKKLEFKCAELNEKLRITNIELADLKTEYTSYKVRAQAVLRQNQTVDHSQEEQLKEEAAALRAQLETLTAKLNTAQEEIIERTTEAESARRRLAEATNDTTRAQQRTARLQSDLTRLSQQLESERSQHKLQVSTLTQCFKTQISDLELKLQKETELLKQQLKTMEESAKPGLSRVKSVEDANRNQFMLPVIPKDDSDGEMDINVSMIPREEGEGSESAPSPPPSKPYLAGGSRSPVPLERLLEEGVPDDEALDTMSLGLTPEQEIADLKRRFTSQQQRVKHVTVLLAESERECARMAQLSELLKAELRRVRGTTANAHNTEYMKNVTLKFLTLPPGDERGRLVPVLQKILTLTHDETQKIQAVAKGLDPNPSKSWGSYLPWPGGK